MKKIGCSPVQFPFQFPKNKHRCIRDPFFQSSLFRSPWYGSLPSLKRDRIGSSGMDRYGCDIHQSHHAHPTHNRILWITVSENHRRYNNVRGNGITKRAVGKSGISSNGSERNGIGCYEDAWSFQEQQLCRGARWIRGGIRRRGKRFGRGRIFTRR